jgi:protoheme IX farnesyltransferase
MLPVVQEDGRSTVRAILLYSVGLIPVSMAPTLLHMTGRIYFIAALLLGIGFLWTGLRLGRTGLAATAPRSKALARHVLIASVFYLPILFAVMMLNSAA